jgi:PST family polysaccharide transporter
MALLGNIKWSAIGVLTRYSLQTASILVLSRLLSPDEFGQVAAVMIVMSLALVVSQLGMGQLISSCNETEVNRKFSQSLIISPSIALIVILSIYSSSDSIAQFFKIGDSLLLNSLLLSILIRSIYAPLEGLFVHYYKFSSIAKVDFISYLFGYFVVSISLSYNGYGSYSIILANIFQSLIALIAITVMFLKINFQFDFSFSPKEFLATFKRALTISYSQLLSGFAAQVDNFFVNLYLGLGQLGIYTRAYQLMVVPCNFSGQILNRVIISRFSKDPEDYQGIIRYGLWLTLLLSTFISFAISFFGLPFVGFLLGDGWDLVHIPLLILSFSIFPRMVYKIVEPVLIAKKLESKLIISLKIYCICLVLSCFLLKGYGLSGVSLGVLLSTHIYGGVSVYNMVAIYPNLKTSAVGTQLLSIITSLLIWNSQ